MERYWARKKIGKNIALYRTNLSKKYELPEETGKNVDETRILHDKSKSTDVDVICKYKFLHTSLISLYVYFFPKYLSEI